MARFISLFLLLTFYFTGSGQQKSRVQYNGSVAAAILRGANGYSFEGEVINGVRYKGIYAGIGVAIDQYYAKSIPLFGALRFDILDKKKTPFVYLHIGTNLQLDKKEFSITSTNYWHSFETDNGLYFDGGLGYSIPIKGQLKFVTSFGISLKDRTENMKWGGYGMDPYAESYHYQFRRYTLKVGLSF
jgi:hypothetical protein